MWTGTQQPIRFPYLEVKEVESNVAELSSGQELYATLFFFQAEDGIRDGTVTGVQTCALPISILWGLALDGADGVQQVLEHLRIELDGAMALTGRTSLKDLDATLVQRA